MLKEHLKNLTAGQEIEFSVKVSPCNNTMYAVFRHMEPCDALTHILPQYAFPNPLIPTSTVCLPCLQLDPTVSTRCRECEGGLSGALYEHASSPGLCFLQRRTCEHIHLCMLSLCRRSKCS